MAFVSLTAINTLNLLDEYAKKLKALDAKSLDYDVFVRLHQFSTIMINLQPYLLKHMYETGMDNIGIIEECVKKYDKRYKPASVEYEKARHEDINFVLNASVEDHHIVDIIYKNFMPAPKYIVDIFEEVHDRYLKKIENHKVDIILKLSGIMSCILLACIFVTNIFRV